MMSSKEGWKPPTQIEPPNGVLVDSLERGRPPHRPRVAAIAAATIVCLGITIGIVAWPGASYRLTHAGAASHVAVKARETTHAPQPGRVDTGADGGQSPVAEPIQSSFDFAQLPPAAAPPSAAPAAAAPATAPPP